MNPNHVLLEIAKMRNATSEKKLQLEVKKPEFFFSWLPEQQGYGILRVTVRCHSSRSTQKFI